MSAVISALRLRIPNPNAARDGERAGGIGGIPKKAAYGPTDGCPFSGKRFGEPGPTTSVTFLQQIGKIGALFYRILSGFIVIRPTRGTDWFSTGR
jgi:hypothetical protein